MLKLVQAVKIWVRLPNLFVRGFLTESSTQNSKVMALDLFLSIILVADMKNIYAEKCFHTKWGESQLNDVLYTMQ